jgi:hypothetical protein
MLALITTLSSLLVCRFRSRRLWNLRALPHQLAVLRRRQQEFIELLKFVGAPLSRAELHLICNNYRIHSRSAVCQRLRRYDR